jgi:hypothetical protein
VREKERLKEKAQHLHDMRQKNWNISSYNT